MCVFVLDTWWIWHTPRIAGQSTSRAPLPLVIESANNALVGPSSATQPQPHQQHGDVVELDPKKLRNRTAAMKCRQKKLNHINEMKRHLVETSEHNKELNAQLAEYKNYLSTLNGLLQVHCAPEGSCRISYCQLTEDWSWWFNWF